MYTENLENSILLKPAKELGCTSLKIISGYTDIECIYRHLINLSDIGKNNKFSVDMILGMTSSNGLSEKKHKDINRLISNIKDNKKMPDFTCRYKINGTDIHSKVYIWLKDNKPVLAFCGSANYSMNAFFKRRECMSDCDFIEANKYFEQLLPDTILATDSSLTEKIHFSKKKDFDSEIDKYNLENLTWDMFANKTPLDVCRISLLTGDGTRTGDISGLNWGQRKGRNSDEAYIPYNSQDKKDDFFPLKQSANEKHNPLFKVIPQNFPPFLMRVAQSGNKGIHSAENNALIGQFFRQRLGIPSGTFITKEMLEKYGKTYVEFKKYKNDIYTLDF